MGNGSEKNINEEPKYKHVQGHKHRVIVLPYVNYLPRIILPNDYHIFLCLIGGFEDKNHH